MAKSRRERLIAAKKLIEKKGWCQGYKVFNQTRTNGYCVATALGDVGDGERAINAIMDDIKFFQKVNDLPNQRDGIGPWNDAPERTKAQVLAAFEKAIEAAA